MNAIEKEVLYSQSILQLWKKYTLVNDDFNADFFDSGGDSLSAINMIVDLQKICHIEISLEQFMRNPTRQFLLDIIQKNGSN
jgi:acyl carrier protein